MYKNFKLTLTKLNDIYSYHEPYKILELIGMVKLYEFCFDQACKAIREILCHGGYAEEGIDSSKRVLKMAYKAGMIDNEDLWLKALASRENIAYAYNKEVAVEIVNQIKEKYYDMFVCLEQKIEQEWS